MMKTSFIGGLIFGLSLLHITLQAPQKLHRSVEPGLSSKDEGLDKGKGVVDAIKCKPGEIESSSGCEKAMKPSGRYNIKVPKLEDTKPGTITVQHETPIIKPSDNNGDNEQEQTKKKKKRPSSDTPFTGKDRPRKFGKDRPRKYVFMPGRRLEKGQRCRPYEVQGKNHRCIRRKRPKTVKPTRKYKTSIPKI